MEQEDIWTASAFNSLGQRKRLPENERESRTILSSSNSLPEKEERGANWKRWKKLGEEMWFEGRRGDIVVGGGRIEKGFRKDCGERTKGKYDLHETRCWIRCQSKSFEHVSLIILASTVLYVSFLSFFLFRDFLSRSRVKGRNIYETNCIPQFLITNDISCLPFPSLVQIWLFSIDQSQLNTLFPCPCLNCAR